MQVVKRPIPLEELFKNRQDKLGTSTGKLKRVLLFGNPGTGKTTIAKKIAYKWSADQWGDTFDMLYLIPVRELSSSNYDDSTIRRQRNLETAITNICFSGESDETYEALRSQVKEELDKENTLIVFDGLDEGEETAKELIRSTESMLCRTMVLSRPQNLQSERSLASVEVECIGLNDEQLVKFIQSKCSSKELVEHLRSHPDVWEISHAPVVANIITFLYKTQKEYIISDESSFNMSSLYWKMSVRIWNRYVEKEKSNAIRDQIFDALEDLAFHTLKDGHIFLDQEIVHSISRDRQTSHVLKDCGFLLLKREGSFYQFPHLTFQEFFAGQYMAHSLLSEDKERIKEAVEFLKEIKYCANFRQVFCFMIRALTSQKREEGYSQVESIVNDKPTALGYQQHLLVNMELLEASLSASRQEDRERLLESTEVLDRAFEWIERRECFRDGLTSNFLCSERIPFFLEIFGASKDDWVQEFIALVVQVTKVARYIPAQWERVEKILEKDLSDKNGTKAAFCLVPLMEAIPEQRVNLWESFLCLFNSEAEAAAASQLSDIARIIPDSVEGIFEEFVISVRENDRFPEEALFAVDYPRLAEVMPDRWQEILETIKRSCIDGIQDIDNELVNPVNQIGRLVELVPESESKAMELVRELSFLGGNEKRRLAMSSLNLIKAMPDKAAEIARILWTLCEDADKAVCDVAKGNVAHVMLSKEERTDSAIDAFLRLSEGGPESTHSSLVRLVAVAYKLIEETPEDVDSLISSLGQEDLTTLWEKVVFCVRDLIGTKTEKEKGLHWLHLMIVKAVKPPEVEEQELCLLLDNVDSDPNKMAVKSAKLLGSLEIPARVNALTALGKLAICCPEHEEEVFNSIEDLTRNEDDEFASEACVHMFSLLEKLPHKAERVTNSLQQSMQRLECFQFLRMRASVSLDSLLEAYKKCQNDFLIFWIVWQSFDTPITMESKENGKSELIVQTSSNNKKRYKFQTVEDAKAFATSFNECLEAAFPDVASLVPTLDSQERRRRKRDVFVNLRERIRRRNPFRANAKERQQSKNPLFANLRERLTTPFWGD